MSRLPAILFYCVAVLLIIYFVYSISTSSFFADKLESEIVEYDTYSDCVSIYGIALRHEKTLTSDKEYTEINYLLDIGDRVAKKGKYASYTTVSLSDEDLKRLSSIDRMITQLTEALSVSTQYDTDALTDKIRSDVISLLNSSDDGNFSELTNNINSLCVSFDQFQIQQDKRSDFEQILKKYKQERENLLSVNGVVEYSLYSSEAGYFSSVVDGYEYLDYEDYPEPTVSDFNEIYSSKPQRITSDVTGKIQTTPGWKFYALFPEEYLSYISVGKNVNLEFEIEYVGKKQMTAKVESVSKIRDGNVCVVFSCNMLNDYTFLFRKENCNFILKSYTGIKVPNEALRISDDGELGVYVLSGNIIIFKKISVVYSTDEYSLVNPVVVSDKVNSTLKTKDEVIIGGKDLFDGKVVNVK